MHFMWPLNANRQSTLKLESNAIEIEIDKMHFNRREQLDIGDSAITISLADSSVNRGRG